MAAPPQSPPSTLSLIIGASLVAGVIGFFIGQASSLGLLPSLSTSKRKRRSKSSSKAGTVDLTDRKDGDSNGSESESDSASEDDIGELKSFADQGNECKMTLVVRTDLGMSKGMSFPLYLKLHLLRLLSKPLSHPAPQTFTSAIAILRNSYPCSKSRTHSPIALSFLFQQT